MKTGYNNRYTSMPAGQVLKAQFAVTSGIAEQRPGRRMNKKD